MKKTILRIKEFAMKYFAVAKCKFELLCDKYIIEVSTDEFDFYKKIEPYPKRYAQCKEQFNDDHLICKKAKFNWFAFVFPVFWSIRIRNSSPVFFLLMITLILAGGLGAIYGNITYNPRWSYYETSTIIAAAASASSICFSLVMIPIRIIFGIYGDSIENIVLFKRLKPVIKFVNETGNTATSGLDKIVKRASWFRITFVYLLIYSPLAFMAFLANSKIH